MAQQFTLKLVNPSAKPTGPQNVIYTGVDGGNSLNLVFKNNSGFDTSFAAGTGASAAVLIKVPRNILDTAAAKLIKVTAPWTLTGITPPEGDTNPADNEGYFILSLTPPPSPGVGFKADAEVMISLSDIGPTAKGNASLIADYTFADLGMKMDPSAQLVVSGSDKPDDKPLMGDNNALRFTLQVNDGPSTNAIVVSETPISTVTGVNNHLHLNLTFQDQNLPSGDDAGQAQLGRLVPKWDPANPPTFRVQFPYFNTNSSFPAALALTDDYPVTDTQNYNALTSAWNIAPSLSRERSVLSNDWWSIELDPLSPVPSWLIRPKSTNLYLFTNTTQGPDSPGPFLDLFFRHIYTVLPISDANPETLLSLQTYNFPGFSDRLNQYPLSKTPGVSISKFTGAVTNVGGRTTLTLDWTTTDAAYCLVSGDSNRQGTESKGDYNKPIDLTNRLASEYTLTAYGKQGTSKIERTVWVRWRQGTQMSNKSYEMPVAIKTSPSGDVVYLAANNVLNMLDPNTLLDSGKTLAPKNGNAVLNVIATSDGSRLYLATMPSEGGGLIEGYTTMLEPLEQPPANVGMNDAPNLFPLALSGDNSQIVAALAYPSGIAERNIAGFATSDTSRFPTAGNPVQLKDLRQMGLAIHGDRLFYPSKEGLGVLNRTTFAPMPGSPVSLKSTDAVSYTPGPLAVSPDGNSVATLATGIIGERRVFILCTVDVPSMALKRRIEVSTGYGTAPPVPTTAIAYSSDGRSLFVFGTDYSQDPPDINKTILSLYDAKTLQPTDWSPVPVSAFFGDFVQAPDSSCFFVSTLETGTGTSGKVVTLTPYFPD